MELSEKPKRFGHHNNGFGALRLIFASMVVLAHTPELIDGNRSRELLTRLFGTISFGELAVNCFFIVSGYLISASYLNSSDAGSYLSKRVARIYPGFIVAFAICAFVVAPLGGAIPHFDVRSLGRLMIDCLLLQPPAIATAFSGSPYPMLNGSLWTIAYEFRCYLLVIALGFLGILRRGHWLLALTVICLILTCVVPVPDAVAWHPTPVASNAGFYSLTDLRITAIGSPRQEFRLLAAFLAGATFYAYRSTIQFTNPLLMVAAVGFVASLFSASLAIAGTIVFGAYLIFAVAEKSGSGILSRINNENDVSYGLYLYAWPVTKLLHWYVPSLSLPVMIIATWLIALVLGWASWLTIEKPVMQLMRSRKAPAQAASMI